LAFSLALMLSLPIMAFSAQPVSAANIQLSKTGTVQANSWEVIAQFRAGNAPILQVTMKVDGPPGTNYTMDFLVLDAQNFNLYSKNLSFNVVPGTTLNTDGYSLNISLQPGFGYYVIADNTDAPSGGAYSHPAVHYSAVGIAKDCGNLQETRSSNQLMIWSGIAVIGAALLIIVIMIRREKS
jgi:hypothetical protein